MNGKMSGITTATLVVAMTGIAGWGCSMSDITNSAGLAGHGYKAYLDHREHKARMEQYKTTDVPSWALTEAAEVISNEIIFELPRHPSVERFTHKHVLRVGDIENFTETRTSEYRGMLSRIETNLLASEAITNRFNIVLERRKHRNYGRSDDAIIDGTSTDGRMTYDPDLVYLISADVYLSERKNANQWQVDTYVTHEKTGEIVIKGTRTIRDRR